MVETSHIADLRAAVEVGAKTIFVERHCDPRRAPCPRPCPCLQPRHAAGEVRRRVARRRRDRRRRADRSRSSYSISTTSTLPSRSSMPGTSRAKRPPMRTRGRLSRGTYAAFNRHELNTTAPDWVHIDHRRGTPFASSDLTAYYPRHRLGPRTGFSIYIEAVHRLSDVGAVVTHAAHGTSQEGFDAEWRMIGLSDCRRRPDQLLRAFRRGRPRRALARFEELQPAGAATGKRGNPKWPNAFWRTSQSRDWDAMAETTGRRLFHRRSPSGRGRRKSDTAEMPTSRTCGPSPTSESRTLR